MHFLEIFVIRHHKLSLGPVHWLNPRTEHISFQFLRISLNILRPLYLILLHLSHYVCILYLFLLLLLLLLLSCLTFRSSLLSLLSCCFFRFRNWLLFNLDWWSWSFRDSSVLELGLDVYVLGKERIHLVKVLAFNWVIIQTLLSVCGLVQSMSVNSPWWLSLYWILWNFTWFKEFRLFHRVSFKVRLLRR